MGLPIGKFIAWTKLGIQLTSVQDAIVAWQKANPMSNKEIAINAAKHFLYTSLAFAGVGAIDHWLVGDVLTTFLSNNFGAAVSLAATPLLKSGLVVVEKLIQRKFVGVESAPVN